MNRLSENGLVKNGLPEISDLMKQESPVFIVGAPRSGTSLLYLTLQRHSKFRPWNCNNDSKAELTESNIFRSPYDTYLAPHSPAFTYMLHNLDCYQQFLETIQPICTHQQFFLGKKHLYKLIPKLPFMQKTTRASLWNALGNDLLIRSFFYHAKYARGMHRIVEKTPQHIFLLPEIKETFPQCKLMFIARHPVDVFSSYRRRLEDSLKHRNSRKGLNWLNVSPRSFCKKYMNSINIALQENTSNSQGFLLLRYEDFVKDAYYALEQILNFLEEPYESGCILEKTTRKPNWQDDPNLFSGIKQRTKEWKNYVDYTTAVLIEDQLTDSMNQLNYSRYTSQY